MTSSVLSVSGPTLKCAAVARMMAQLGLTGDVTDNLTVMPGGDMEHGCRIQLTKGTTKREGAKRLWEELQKKEGLTCAHVVIEEKTAGCVFDVWRPSACPGRPDPADANT